MSLLFPAALGLLALALPVLAFYLMRQRARPRPVSTLLFWEQIDPQVHNRPLWRRLRNWLSYLLQVLFLLLLALALARPLWTGGLEPQAWVCVVDTSPSMFAQHAEGERPWDAVAAQLREDFRGLGPGDQAMLLELAASPRIRQGWTDNRRQLVAALEEITSAEEAAEALPTLDLARNLAASVPNARIRLYTDRILVLPDGLEGVEVVAVEPAEANSGIVHFGIRRDPAVPGIFVLTATLAAHGEAALAGDLSLRRDGQLVDARRLNEADGRFTPTWREQGEAAHTFTLTWEPAGDDALADDNTATVALGPLTPVVVNLVGPRNGFLEAVFRSMAQVRVQVAPVPEELPAVAAATPVLWVWTGGEMLPPGDRPSLYLAPTGEGVWGTRTGELERPLITAVDREAFLVRFAGLEQIRVRAAGAYAPPPGADIWAESFGEPLIYGRWDERSRWVVFAFPLEASDFSLRTAFPIVMGNVVQGLREEAAGTQAPLPGEGETRLRETTVELPMAGAGARWWSFLAFPLWWWLIIAGAAWCLLEWWLYSRRITE